MNNKTYTILDLSEEFGKDKQLIRRRIAKLKIQSINKNTREYSNDPLEYSKKSYIELADYFGVSKSNTRDTHNDKQSNTQQYTDDSNKNKLIEILERELEHSKSKLEKAEQEKDNLYRLLDQQQRLSLSDKNKIEILELELKENSNPIEILEEKEIEKKESKKPKWYDIFKKKV